MIGDFELSQMRDRCERIVGASWSKLLPCERFDAGRHTGLLTKDHLVQFRTPGTMSTSLVVWLLYFYGCFNVRMIVTLMCCCQSGHYFVKHLISIMVVDGWRDASKRFDQNGSPESRSETPQSNPGLKLIFRGAAWRLVDILDLINPLMFVFLHKSCWFCVMKYKKKHISIITLKYLVRHKAAFLPWEIERNPKHLFHKLCFYNASVNLLFQWCRKCSKSYHGIFADSHVIKSINHGVKD